MQSEPFEDTLSPRPTGRKGIFLGDSSTTEVICLTDRFQIIDVAVPSSAGISQCVVADSSGRIQKWDCFTGQRTSIPVQWPSTPSISAIAVDPRLRLLAVSHCNDQSSSFVSVIDIESGECTQSWKLSESTEMSQLRFDHSGDRLIGLEDGPQSSSLVTIREWVVRSSSVNPWMRAVNSFMDYLTSTPESIRWTFDQGRNTSYSTTRWIGFWGDSIIAVSRRGSLTVWNNPQYPDTPHSSALNLTHFDIAADGRIIGTEGATTQSANIVRLSRFDAVLRPSHVLRLPFSCFALACHPTDPELLIVSSDRSIRVWNLLTDRETHRFRTVGPLTWIRMVGSVIVLRSQRNASLINMDRRFQARKVDPPAEERTVFAPLRTRPVLEGLLPSSLLSSHTVLSNHSLFGPLSRGSSVDRVDFDTSLRVRSDMFCNRSEPVRKVLLSPMHQRWLVSVSDTELNLFRAWDGRHLRTVLPASVCLRCFGDCCSFDRSGLLLLLGGPHSLQVWRVPDNRLFRSLKIRSLSSVISLKAHRVLVGRRDNLIQIWDVLHKCMVVSVTWAGNSVVCELATNLSESLIAVSFQSGMRRSITVFTFPDFHQVFELGCVSWADARFQFHPVFQHLLLVGSAEEPWCLWDVWKGQQIGAVSTDARITRVCFSPNGWLFSAVSDRSWSLNQLSLSLTTDIIINICDHWMRVEDEEEDKEGDPSQVLISLFRPRLVLIPRDLVRVIRFFI